MAGQPTGSSNCLSQKDSCELNGEQILYRDKKREGQLGNRGYSGDMVVWSVWELDAVETSSVWEVGSAGFLRSYLGC